MSQHTKKWKAPGSGGAPRPSVEGGMKRLQHSVTGGFRFRNFSQRQAQLVTWWMKHRELDGVIAEGAIRSGKTIGVITGWVLWTLIEFHARGIEADFIVASKSMGALKRNILKEMFKILRTFSIPYEYNRSAEAPYVKIGLVTYYLFAGNNEASQDVLQGFTAAGCLLDEVVLMPESFVEQATARCSIEGSKYWFTCNPGGPRHWFKLKYVDQAKKKRLLRLHFTLDDNPSLAKSRREAFHRNYVGVFYQRYILGLWVLAEGLVYSMWKRDAHMLAPEAIPGPFRHYAVSCDYGSTNPTVFGLFGWNEGGSVYLVRMWYHDPVKKGRDYTDGEYADRFDAWLEESLPLGGAVEKVVIDPSAKSFATELRRRGYEVTKAKNDVADGIRFVASCLHASKLAQTPKSDEGAVRFFVQDLPEMEPLEDEFGQYAWNQKAAERGADEPIKAFDHCLDMIRYLLFTLFYRKRSSDISGWVRATR